MRTRYKTVSLAGFLAGFSTIAVAQTPLGSTITYQGRLSQAGAPADGTYVMQFSLWDSVVAGVQIGPTVTFDGIGGNPPGVTVAEGLFTTGLDFGGDAFSGEARWLQISVNGTPLSPRQPVTAAPYAMRAASVTGIDGFSLDAADGNPVDVLRADDNGNLGVLNNQFLGFNPADTFSHDTPPKVMGHYALGWFNDSSNPSGQTAWFSGWGGMKFFTQGTPRLSVTQQGNVGIGTQTPESKLEVAGELTLDPAAGNNSALTFNIGNAEQAQIYANFGDSSLRVRTAGADRMTISAAGNVGIGVSDPSAGLHVVRQPANFRGTLSLEGVQHTFMSFYPDGPATRKAWMGFGSANDDNLSIANETSNADIVLATGGTGATRATNINVTGGVIRKGGLPVSGVTDMGLYSLTAGWMRFVSNNSPIHFFTDSTAGTSPTPAPNSTVMTIAANGDVGINTTAPETALHVRRNAEAFRLEGTSHAFMSFFPHGPSTRKGYFGFADLNNQIYLVNETGGNVHIGTVGSGRTTCNVLEILGGSDLAEPFEASEADCIDPGMVVCIDPNNPGKLRLSGSPYDRRVAGIISGAGGVKTGMMLRQEGSIADGKHPVALTGRVYCYVDADAGGAVQPGDLLTTSATRGHAMKAGDPSRAPGAIIGKAMTSLDDGRGLVLVLVSLQ